MILRKVVVVTTVLIIVSLIFSIVLPELLKSEEHIESLAEGVEPVIAVKYWTPFKEYTIRGLPDWLSYMISAILSYAIIIAIYYSVYYVLLKLEMPRRNNGYFKSFLQYC